MMDQTLNLPDDIWTRLNLSWATFFFVLGILNLYVVYNFDTETWVNFKLFGLLGLTVVFMVGQGIYLMRHMPSEDEPSGE